MSKVYEYHLTILEHHLDTFGHVNNAVYAQILEEARWDVITNNGYGLKEVIENKIGPVVLEMKVQFKRELKLREPIIVQTKVINGNQKIAKMEQIILKADRSESCVAEFMFGLMDLKQRKLIEPTPAWLKAVGY